MVVAEVALPGVTTAQLQVPVLVRAIEDGFKASLGFDTTDTSASGCDVTLTHVDGVKLVDIANTNPNVRLLLSEQRLQHSTPLQDARHLAADPNTPSLTFEVEAGVVADDSSTTALLKSNIAEAVTGLPGGNGGSLVAFVKREAAAAGVLTAELKAVRDDVAMNLKPLETKTSVRIVVVQVRAVPVPVTVVPSGVPSHESDGVSSGDIKGHGQQGQAETSMKSGAAPMSMSIRSRIVTLSITFLLLVQAAQQGAG